MTVYVVVKFGGEYEDKWESIDSVYASREAAEKRVKEIEKEFTTTVSRERWDSLVQEVEDYEYGQDADFETFIEGILFLHSEWRDTEIEENLREAELAYYYNSDTYGAMIEEAEYYN